MRPEELKYLEIGKSIIDAEESQMFGKPCFKTNGKAFVCYFNDSMVFKLKGEIHAIAATLKGAQLFDPSGRNRPMKEWVQVPYVHHEKWLEFAHAAIEYVNSTKTK